MENNDKFEFSQRLRDKMEAELENHGIEIVSDLSEILGDYENEDDKDAVVLSPGMLPPNIRKRAEELKNPPAPKGFHYEDGILMMDTDEDDSIQEISEEKPSEEKEESSSSSSEIPKEEPKQEPKKEESDGLEDVDSPIPRNDDKEEKSKSSSSSQYLLLSRSSSRAFICSNTSFIVLIIIGFTKYRINLSTI